MIDNLDKVVVFYPSKTYQIIRGGVDKPNHLVNFSENHDDKENKILDFKQRQVEKTHLKNKNIYPSLMMKGLFVIAIFLMGTHLAHAEDLLAGAFEDANQTFIGTGKKFIYLAEIIISIVGFIKTRNILIFSGCVIIAIFLNVGLRMVGA